MPKNAADGCSRAPRRVSRLGQDAAEARAFQSGLPADVLYDAASEKFEASLALRPDTGAARNPAFNEWGASLARQEENLRVEDSAFFKGKFMQAVVAKCLEEGTTKPMREFMTGTNIKTELHKELRLKAFRSSSPLSPIVRGARGRAESGSPRNFDLAAVVQSPHVNAPRGRRGSLSRFHPSTKSTRIRALSTVNAAAAVSTMPPSPLGRYSEQ